MRSVSQNEVSQPAKEEHQNCAIFAMGSLPHRRNQAAAGFHSNQDLTVGSNEDQNGDQMPLVEDLVDQVLDQVEVPLGPELVGDFNDPAPPPAVARLIESRQPVGHAHGNVSLGSNDDYQVFFASVRRSFRLERGQVNVTFEEIPIFPGRRHGTYLPVFVGRRRRGHFTVESNRLEELANLLVTQLVRVHGTKTSKAVASQGGKIVLQVLYTLTQQEHHSFYFYFELKGSYSPGAKGVFEWIHQKWKTAVRSLRRSLSQVQLPPIDHSLVVPRVGRQPQVSAFWSTYDQLVQDLERKLHTLGNGAQRAEHANTESSIAASRELFLRSVRLELQNFFLAIENLLLRGET